MKNNYLGFSLLLLLSCGNKNENYVDNLPAEADFDSTKIIVKDSANGLVVFQKPVDSAALLAAELKKIELEKIKKTNLEKEKEEKKETKALDITTEETPPKTEE